MMKSSSFCGTAINPNFSYEDYANFDLACITEAECKAKFRVEKNDLEDLAEVLQIPETFVCSQRSVCSGIKGLCIALKRLAYPCRYSDMIYCFEASASTIYDHKHSDKLHL